MRDLLITSKQQKTEIRWFVASFSMAFLLNVFAISYYKTAWRELYSQLLWVCIITCFLYALSVMIRVGIGIAVYLYKRFF